MGNEFSKELNLSAELNAVCDEHGKEVDIAKSAPILHQYGLLYRNKSPNKIDLIRSAVFFNAAITRQPSNQQFKTDLKELCSHVIKLAGQHQPTQNVISVSEQIKIQVTDMRENTKEQLSQLHEIPVGLSLSELCSQKINKVYMIRRLQTRITSSFIAIMSIVSQKCIELIGNPPCQYAIVSICYSVNIMGLLARQEVTPYSDFEHIIVLEENVQYLPNYIHILDYFRWFTVVFQIIVINLGETIIPAISVPLLNNPNIPCGDWFFDCHTMRGISFDGMMLHACKFPLGRFQPTNNKPFTTELIKPVSEMANYLQAEEDIKNGYHLADILTKTCFVYGNRNVYEKFESLAKSVLNCNVASNFNQIQTQLQKDLQTYDIRKTINQSGFLKNWNIKRIIYRSSTLFVSALGRFHRIAKCSCFDIIDELLSEEKISKNVAEQLSFAIAVACETRLKVYITQQSQNDNVGSRNFFRFVNNITLKLCELIGEQSLGDYFLTVQAFQQCLGLNDFQSDEFVEISNPKKFYTLFVLDLHNLVLAEWERYKQENKFESNCGVNYYVAWTYMKKGKFQQAMELLSIVEDHKEKIDYLSLEVKRRKANCFCELRQYKEGLQYINQCLSKALLFDYHAFAYMIALKGDCERHLGVLDNAIQSYTLAILNLQLSCSLFRRNLQAKCCVFRGQCFLQREQFLKAIENGKMALDICKNSTLEISLECKCNRLLADCYMHLKQPHKSLNYHEAELKLRGCQRTNKHDTSDSSEKSVLRAKIQKAKNALKF